MKYGTAIPFFAATPVFSNELVGWGLNVISFKGSWLVTRPDHHIAHRICCHDWERFCSFHLATRQNRNGLGCHSFYLQANRKYYYNDIHALRMEIHWSRAGLIQRTSSSVRRYIWLTDIPLSSVDVLGVRVKETSRDSLQKYTAVTNWLEDGQTWALSGSQPRTVLTEKWKLSKQWP